MSPSTGTAPTGLSRGRQAWRWSILHGYERTFSSALCHFRGINIPADEGARGNFPLLFPSAMKSMGSSVCEFRLELQLPFHCHCSLDRLRSVVTADILHGAAAAACPAVISYNGSVWERGCLALFSGGDEKQLLSSNTVLTLTIMKWVINCFALMRPCIYCL